MDLDIEMMKKVLELSNQAFLESEVPVACIITRKNQIIAQEYNKKEKMLLSTSHAEILAIQEASKKLKRWRLNDCTIYVNLEPCLMCMGAIIEARFDKLVFGAYDYNRGGINGRYGIGEEKLNLTKLSLSSGVLADESQNILREFFKNKR